MPQIRKAHSVEIIDKRLRDCETAGVEDVDVMELVGLYDELARVERKWVEKPKQPPRSGARARPPANPALMNARFERLRHLIDAALRRRPSQSADSPGRELLQRAADALHACQPLPQ